MHTNAYTASVKIQQALLHLIISLYAEFQKITTTTLQPEVTIRMLVAIYQNITSVCQIQRSL